MTSTVQGPGGTGKTFLYKTLYYYFRTQDIPVSIQQMYSFKAVSVIQVLNVAHTGIAATLLICGSTVHRQFSVPLKLTEGKTCEVSPESEQGRLIQQARVIMWDEAVMSDKRVSISNFTSLA